MSNKPMSPHIILNRFFASIITRGIEKPPVMCYYFFRKKGETGATPVRARRREAQNRFFLPEAATSGTSHWFFPRR